MATVTPTCTTVYDTITSPSGTVSKTPRQVCSISTTPATTASIQSTTVSQPTIATTSQNQTVQPQTQTVATVNTVAVSATSNSGSVYTDGVYVGTGKYLYTGGNIDYSVSITIGSGKIASASFLNFTTSGNGKYTRDQGDTILQKLIGTTSTKIDTVTGATGTSQAIQDAIDNALAKAISTSSQSAAVATATTSTGTTLADTGATASGTTVDNIPSSEFYTAPNGKKYTIHFLSTGKYIFERPDGTFSSQKFDTREAIVSVIDANNQYKDTTHLTVVGKEYTIVKNVTTGKFTFRRPNGSLSNQSFDTASSVSTYIRVNNRPIIQQTASTVQTVAPKVVAKRKAIVKRSVTVSTPKASTPAPVAKTTTTNTASVAAAEKARAAAAAQSQAAAEAAAAKARAAAVAAQTPKPAPAPAKVDTTTRAS